MSGKSMPVDLDHVKPFMGFCTTFTYWCTNLLLLLLLFQPMKSNSKILQVQKNPANNFVFCLPGYSCSDMKILTPFTYPVPCRHWSWKMHEPVPNNFQKSLTPRNWIWMVMDMGLLAVSIYQTPPKSKQELQVTSFNPNATATAVEQPAATEFGPGGYEWSWTWDCWLSRSIKHGQNPSRSCRSPVSTRMLLLQRSNSQLLLSLDQKLIPE